MILSLINLKCGYGKVLVAENINIHVNEKEVVGLYGPNGAGKTTLLKTIAGILKPLGGKIYFMGRDITHLQPYERVKLGIRYIPDRGNVFKSLSVEDNIRLVYSGEIEWDKFSLRVNPKTRAGDLSGGQIRLLSLAIAYYSRPSLLLLDEPSQGLFQRAKDEVSDILRKLKNEGVTMLIAEQDIEFLRKIADRIYIIESGIILKEVTKTDEIINEKIV
ncbi:MAG: ATP-binding cassette domain-containing protein [Thermofilaceae archaeon]